MFIRPIAAKMLLHYLALGFFGFGVLEAQKMHITISPKEASPQSAPAKGEETAPVFKQLLRNYKEVRMCLIVNHTFL